MTDPRPRIGGSLGAVPALKPRAVEVLVALSRGPLSDLQLSRRIGLARSSAAVARALCGAMSDPGDPIYNLIGKTPEGLWYLSSGGVAWLKTNGLGVAL